MRTILFILVSFVAFTSTLSGFLMIIDSDGGKLNLPLSLLENTPFKNYMIPGIILTLIVGGVNLVAVFFNMRRYSNRYNWAMAGGSIIILWLLVQIMLIHTAHWLHFIYLGIGMLIILISYQLKGKWAV